MILKKLLPTSIKHGIRRALHRMLPARLTSESAAAFTPAGARDGRPLYHLDLTSAPGAPGPDGLPVPPASLRMGYGTADEFYCNEGKAVAEVLRDRAAAHGVPLDSVGRIMELGCATGRVLRQFRDVAEEAEVWGVDQHEESILWAKTNLSPPFRFVTTTRLPHLPFEDRYFDFVYGISVFTHVEFLVDHWLMELRRIVRPGGLVMLTVHNEDSIDHLIAHGRPPWIGREISLESLKSADSTFVPFGVPGTVARHDSALAFWRSDAVRQEWGRYFEVREIVPCAIDRFQTLVVLARPAEG